MINKILLWMVLFCSFTLAIDIYYGDGNCDLKIDEKDMNILIDLISGHDVHEKCCIEGCKNLDINNDNVFNSTDLFLLTKIMYENETREIHSNISMDQFISHYGSFICHNETIYVNQTNYTIVNDTNLTIEYCKGNYNLTRIEDIVCPVCEACPPCPPPITETVEREVNVYHDKIWNWKTIMIMVFLMITGFGLGYWYVNNHGG